MKKLIYLMITVSSLSFCADNLEQAIEKIILSDSEAQEHIERIKDIQDQIKQLEDAQGITELHKQMANLRYNNCVYQQKTPRIKKFLDEIEHIQQIIKNKTKSERDQINKLYLALEKSGQNQEIQNKIQSLQNSIKNKARAEFQKISDLNKQIKTMMSDKIKQAKTIANTISNKYKAITSKIKSLDAQLKKEIDAVNTLFQDNDTLRTARKNLSKARKNMLRTNPCKKPTTESSWLIFFE